MKRAQIESMEGLAKTHFLNENAQRINKSLGDLTGLTRLGFHIVEVSPGHETTEYHVHQFEDECVYVLEGRGEAHIGEEKFAVEAGDFIGYRLGGLAHSIVNTGDGVLRCVVAGSRRDHDVCDYPRKSKRLYRNAGMDWDLVDQHAVAHPTAGRKA